MKRSLYEIWFLVNVRFFRTVLIISKLAALAFLLTVFVVIWPIMRDNDWSLGQWAIEVPLDLSCLVSGAVGVLVYPLPEKE